jgi:hypothetical protein
MRVPGRTICAATRVVTVGLAVTSVVSLAAPQAVVKPPLGGRAAIVSR